MSSSTGTPGHSHDLHVVIPTTKSQSVPSANVSKSTSPLTPGHSHALFTTLASGPALLEDPPLTPGHGHALFGIDGVTKGHSHFRVLDDTPGHGHGLFRIPEADGSPVSSPTHPRPSARIARRSSLFETNMNHGAEEAHEPDVDVAQQIMLPPTAEAHEPSTAELDGSFEKPANGSTQQTRTPEESA